jgi:hypothetical protein
VVSLEISDLMVIHTPQVWKLILQLFKNRTLDTHETRGSVEDLDEPVINRTIGSPKIYDETRCHLGGITGISLLDGVGTLVPHHHLFGVACYGYVVIGTDEADDGLGVEVDVGVDEDEEVGVGLLHEPPHRHIAGAVNETFILCGVNHEIDALLDGEDLQSKD